MSNPVALPRLAVAGLSGESGKTLVALCLIFAAQQRGIPVRGFKKGPDYIDSAWLSWATGAPVRNLDTYLMDFHGAVSSFARHAVPNGLNVIEGNRGLYDGVDAHGTHSTAGLSKALSAPVILVASAAKVTRTVAACVLGCQKLDPNVNLAGVVLNRMSSRRHEQIARQAIENICGIPVLGVLPRVRSGVLVPERHLGLVTPEEHEPTQRLRSELIELVEGRLNVDALLALAWKAPPLPPAAQVAPHSSDGAGLRIAYIRDSAFSFYYPDNLEALESAGAEIVPVSSLAAATLPPDLDGLYIGGGFPETHADALSANQSFLESLRLAAASGLPIYAECGGLMLLSRGFRWRGRTFPMSGVFPFEVEVCDTPQGHGYAHLTVDSPNPFFPVGLSLKGHEFHYSKIVIECDPPRAVCAVHRGVGCYNNRDGIVAGNVMATYTHLHAVVTPGWASGLISAARRFSARR